MDIFTIVLIGAGFIIGEMHGSESGYKKAQQEALVRQAHIEQQREWEKNFKNYMNYKGDGDDNEE
jgi:hypothetical protein